MCTRVDLDDGAVGNGFTSYKSNRGQDSQGESLGEGCYGIDRSSSHTSCCPSYVYRQHRAFLHHWWMPAACFLAEMLGSRSPTRDSGNQLRPFTSSHPAPLTPRLVRRTTNHYTRAIPASRRTDRRRPKGQQPLVHRDPAAVNASPLPRARPPALPHLMISTPAAFSEA